MISDALQSPPKCRIAVVGVNHQRVARVIALIHRSGEGDGSESTKLFISPVTNQCLLSEEDLPKEIPTQIEIEYLPCVATFDSYEDESGNVIRYLVKIEYHGVHGTLTNGKSLAPFFDDDGSARDDSENIFPGISAVAVGCGIDTDDDNEKIASFFNSLSRSCQQVTRTDLDDNHELLVELNKCNPEYSSMKEENDAYRNLSEDEKQDAITKQTIGPGKMAKFVYEIAQKVVCQKWSKELKALEQDLSSSNPTVENLEIEEAALAGLSEQVEDLQLSTNNGTNGTTQSKPDNVHLPDPERIRYACKRCRTVLFGEADLEDPPHAQSLHGFRKKSASKTKQSSTCANHFLSGPLPWMDALDGMEGKLHCLQCKTKIGHYSWTGAQCSCGTWVTPAIMIPMSKVDEMLPGRSLFLDSNYTSGLLSTANGVNANTTLIEPSDDVTHC